MLRIGLADDEKEVLDLEEGLLRNYLAKKGISGCIDTFQEPESLYAVFREGKTYDICFLDIGMPQMDGRELAGKIRESDEAVNLVFLTQHSEFVRVGYQVGAFDFIVKDRLGEELPDVMDRLLRKIERDAHRFYTVTTHSRYEKIAYRDIIYIYKQGQNIRFVLKTGEVQERKSLKRISGELDGEEFMLVERGYIINLSHVVRLCAREIELSNGKKLMVSKEHIQNVRKRLGMYCMHAMSDRKE